MKLERSKDWWIARARREGSAAIGAGMLALDAKPEDHSSPSPAPTASKAVAMSGSTATIGTAAPGPSTNIPCHECNGTGELWVEASYPECAEELAEYFADDPGANPLNLETA